MSKYLTVLKQIREILGDPCSSNKCAGCREEMTTVSELLTKVLGKYKKRKLTKKTLRRILLTPRRSKLMSPTTRSVAPSHAASRQPARQ